MDTPPSGPGGPECRIFEHVDGHGGVPQGGWNSSPYAVLPRGPHTLRTVRVACLKELNVVLETFLEPAHLRDAGRAPLAIDSATLNGFGPAELGLSRETVAEESYTDCAFEIEEYGGVYLLHATSLAHYVLLVRPYGNLCGTDEDWQRLRVSHTHVLHSGDLIRVAGAWHGTFMFIDGVSGNAIHRTLGPAARGRRRGARVPRARRPLSPRAARI